MYLCYVTRVAERSVDLWSFFEKKGRGIRSENADISNDKLCSRIIVAESLRVSNDKSSTYSIKTVPKVKAKAVADGMFL